MSFPLFSLVAFILMLVLQPILFGELMATSFGKLHLSPEMAVAAHGDRNRRVNQYPGKAHSA